MAQGLAASFRALVETFRSTDERAHVLILSLDQIVLTSTERLTQSRALLAEVDAMLKRK